MGRGWLASSIRHDLALSEDSCARNGGARSEPGGGPERDRGRDVHIGLDAYTRDESELAASCSQALSSGVQAGMRRLGRSWATAQARRRLPSRTRFSPPRLPLQTPAEERRRTSPRWAFSPCVIVVHGILVYGERTGSREPELRITGALVAARLPRASSRGGDSSDLRLSSRVSWSVGRMPPCSSPPRLSRSSDGCSRRCRAGRGGTSNWSLLGDDAQPQLEFDEPS